MSLDWQSTGESGTVKFRGEVFEIIEVRDPRTGATLEFARAPDVVRVYALQDSQVYLIRERRPGLSEERLLRAVSGSVEPGESSEGAARRELLEEAGIEAEDFNLFHESLLGLKMMYRVLHYTCNVTSIQPQRLEAEEDIAVISASLKDVERFAWAGEFVEDLTAFAALKLVRDLT